MARLCEDGAPMGDEARAVLDAAAVECFQFPGTPSPAVLYQPALFGKGALTHLTSHVDLLPTLLDAMGIPFDRSRVQGESNFEPELQRKYILATGAMGQLASIADDGSKLILDFRRDSCVVYDLATDPLEREARSCSSRSGQLGDALRYRRYQSAILERLFQEHASSGVRAPLRAGSSLP